VLRSTLLDSAWELAGQGWLRPPGKLGYSRLGWLPARVPGHVHTSLVEQGVIADPFVALGELGCQWVDEEDWSYRTRFLFQPDPTLPKRRLVFEGLDGVCTVLLNGEAIAQHDNMFVPLEVEVSDRLESGTNELRVDFASAVRVGRERRARYFQREGLSPDVVSFDERAFVRKAQYMYGWDWGPRLVSAGLWRPVRLLEYTGRIVEVEVRQIYRTDGTVELRFASHTEGSGEVWHWIEGFPNPIRDGETCRIDAPELWWPASLGPQQLYTVKSLLLPRPPRARASSEAEALDQAETRIGLRTVRLVRTPDAWGESFQFEINGRPLWAMGGNWICDHSLPSAVTRQRVRAQLLRARDLNFNMLRVWGGGLYETQDFYHACDELGLLVWQDFAYACSYYPEDREALEAARREAEANVRRLRHHASLVLWCGNNENASMFHGHWGGRAHQPPRYYGEKIYHEVLPEVLARLDPDRPYWPSSPWGGENPNQGGIGDQHYWDVWHGRGDYLNFADSTARFASEFGFCAAPGHAVWRRMLPEARDLTVVEVGHPTARWHDKTGKGYETFVALVELHYPRAQNLEEWIYYSQLNQRDALRYAIEHYRRSEFCRGALVWQLNDCWPVQSWSVIDSEGEYKAAAYELRRLFAPALVSLERVGQTVRLWTLLDHTLTRVRGPAVLEARALDDGEALGHWETTVDLGVGDRRVALEVDLAVFDARRTLLVGSFAGSSTARLLSEPKEVELGAEPLTVQVTAAGLVVESDFPVVDLCLRDDGGDLKLLDNWITFPRPGSMLLNATGRPGRLVARSLAGIHCVRTKD
jgi:beta-mannosidase